MLQTTVCKNDPPQRLSLSQTVSLTNTYQSDTIQVALALSSFYVLIFSDCLKCGLSNIKQFQRTIITLQNRAVICVFSHNSYLKKKLGKEVGWKSAYWGGSNGKHCSAVLTRAVSDMLIEYMQSKYPVWERLGCWIVKSIMKGWGSVLFRVTQSTTNDYIPNSRNPLKYFYG